MKNTKPITEKQVSLAVTGLAPFARLEAAAPRFKKEVLRAGRWIHPGTGERLDFDLGLLERLAQDTNRWLALGNKVPFPAGPDCHDDDARDALRNLGYWSNFRVEDERLVADVEVLDQDALPKIGKTIQDVSPEIRWPARSATGETLDAAIFHVAATPSPAIPGQKNFERLSRLAREVPMAEEKPTEPGGSPDKGAETEDTKALDVLAWARARLGLPADAPAQAVLEALEQRIEAAARTQTPDPSALTQLARDVKELRERGAREKRTRAEETVALARRRSAEAGLPIPEDTCRVVLSLFARDEDEAARELLSAWAARIDASRLHLSRVAPAPTVGEAPPSQQATWERAEKLLLERDGWIVRTNPDGTTKRDAHGNPLLVRRKKGEE